MPNPVIHDFFKEQVESRAGAPFQETQSMLRAPKGLPELWATLEYDPGSTQRLSCGMPYLLREFGTATAVFLVKSGKGVAAVQQAAQAFADGVRDLQVRLDEGTGVIGTLRLDNVGPPSPEPFEDGNWLVCSVACVYTYDSVRGAADQASTTP